jgi:alanyl-tRNA synthetase
MQVDELRERYQRFFEAEGHRRLRSAPLLPENDPTVLFTTAGMHPLVPFLLGEPHPLGRRLVDVQKCLRTDDIDEVGDASHLTFFEMLGNWSLGDYFKAESLSWSYRFLTNELGLDPSRLAVTVFAGDGDAPRDEESAAIWRRLGMPDDRIHFLPKSDNWRGPAGSTGPCGPDSEIFYDTRPARVGDHPGCRPGCGCGRWLEIWNNVFMEYFKTPDGSYERLGRRNVDTGMGVERTAAVLQGLGDVFLVETIYPLVQRVEQLAGTSYASNPRPFRVIVDHLRAATFAIADGALPSNKDAGYVVRRLVRRAVRQAHTLGITGNFCAGLSGCVVDLLGRAYPELPEARERIAAELDREERKFRATLERGLRQFRRVADAAVSDAAASGDLDRVIGAAAAFDLFQTYGFPLSLSIELAAEEGLRVDEAGFATLLEEHRNVSRQGLERKFKGGLADHAQETTRLHTATHLLHEALRRVLGPSVHQMGSNITAERLRFDFSYDERLTDEQIEEVECLVNDQIGRDLPVTTQIILLDDAKASGALAFFDEKYGAEVKVYTIGDFSREVCGGPHVDHTAELGRFHIVNQESPGQGVRRIRAVLDGHNSGQSRG